MGATLFVACEGEGATEGVADKGHAYIYGREARAVNSTMDMDMHMHMLVWLWGTSRLDT